MQSLRTGVAIARQTDVASAAQLLILAGSAVHGSNPSLSRTYYREAMDMAENMPLDSPINHRVSIQNAAVAGITASDPVSALQLFRRIDKPDWTAFPQTDTRGTTASTIVRALLAKAGSSKANDLIALLEYAGNTGEYPYDAGSALLVELKKRHRGDLISQVFSNALRHIERDETFTSAPGDFAELVLSHENSLPRSLCVEGIRAAVEAARRFDTKQQKEPTGSEHRTMVLSKPDSQVRISKQATYIALHLLPLASRLDEGLAEELKHNDPDLQALTAGATKGQLSNLATGHSSVIIGDGGVATTQVGTLIRDHEESRNLIELSQHDPEKAIAGLAVIQDVSTNVQTQTAIAQTLIRSDPARATAMLEVAWKKSEKIEDPKQHVQALTRIADTWSELNDPAHVHSVVLDGLELAQKMYGASKNEKVDMFFLRPGVDELGELAGLLARVDAQAGAQLAQSIDSPEAKAYVLLSIARVLLNFPPISQTKSQSQSN